MTLFSLEDAFEQYCLSSIEVLKASKEEGFSLKSRDDKTRQSGRVKSKYIAPHQRFPVGVSSQPLLQSEQRLLLKSASMDSVRKKTSTSKFKPPRSVSSKWSTPRNPRAQTWKRGNQQSSFPRGRTSVDRRRSSVQSSASSSATSEEVYSHSGGRVSNRQGKKTTGDGEDAENDDDSLSSTPRSPMIIDKCQAEDETEVHPPLIPPALLTKLFHHHFQNTDTRMGSEARSLAGKYVETFVREAIARAAFERGESLKEKAAAGSKGRIGEGDFLEVSKVSVGVGMQATFFSHKLESKQWSGD